MTLPRIGFWFLRHGETEWNAQNLSQGNVDIPLNPKGEAQARAAAALLVHRGIATIVASPLSRAVETARVVGAAIDVPVSVDEGLREVSFGVQEGKPMGDWFSSWVAGTFTPEHGESFAHLRARGRLAFARALERPPVVLIVAHGALFRAMRAEMGLTPDFRTPNGEPVFCAPPASHAEAWTLCPARPLAPTAAIG